MIIRNEASRFYSSENVELNQTKQVLEILIVKSCNIYIASQEFSDDDDFRRYKVKGKDKNYPFNYTQQTCKVIQIDE